MQSKLTNQVRGYLRIRITGYSPERFLNLCKHRGIELWGLESKANAYEMYMTVNGFRQLKPILRKTRTRITIQKRYGVPFFFHKYRKRKLFFIGLFLCLCMIYVLSRFIWNIEIDGNQAITDEVLIEYLENENTYHGMRRNKVDCESIVTNIRKQFQDIIWVSASLEGCNLIIQVKENTDTFQVSQTEEETGDIVASVDGVITEIITRSGVPCVQAGDAVKAGDLLVSGTVEVKNDAGEVVREERKQADADIYAERIISYEEVCENQYFVKEYHSLKQGQFYVKIFDMQCSLGILKSNTENLEISSKEQRLKLGDNFELPFSYGIKLGKIYEETEKEYTTEEKEAILNQKIALYKKELEESGITILSEQIQFSEEPGCTRATGLFKVNQSIGTIRKSVDSDM